jgi:hypothetical protein
MMSVSVKSPEMKFETKQPLMSFDEITEKPYAAPAIKPSMY